MAINRNRGLDKVRHVSEHINLILQYIPFVQTNFILGLDSDEGAEPFELTKTFLDLTPGAYPAFSLCTAPGFSDTRQRYAAACVVIVAAIQCRRVSAGLR